MGDVAVVITAYNTGKWLREAVDSVRSQTLPPSQLILVDDCSTDSITPRVLSELAAEGHVVISTPTNSGPSAARNLAMEQVHADYVVMLDGDDLLGPAHLEIGSSTLDADQGVGIVRTQTHFFGGGTGPLPPGPPGIPPLLLVNSVPAASMFRREDFEAVGGYDPQLRLYEDHDLWLGILELGRDLYVADKVTHFYRQHDAQATSRIDDAQNLAAKVLIMRKHSALYRHHADELWRLIGQQETLLASFKRRFGWVLRGRARLRRWVGR